MQFVTRQTTGVLASVAAFGNGTRRPRSTVSVGAIVTSRLSLPHPSHPQCATQDGQGAYVTAHADLHYFTVEQPDLNWENPEVRQAIYRDAVRFWLDRGVDGFRIDTVNMFSRPSILIIS